GLGRRSVVIRGAALACHHARQGTRCGKLIEGGPMRLIVLAVLVTVACPAAAQATLSPADQAAAFTAAGFKRVAGAWRACEDPGTASYQAGEIEQVVDLNGDGRP